MQYICTIKELKRGNYVVKFIEKWKDELITFFDLKEDKIKIFSSICPHFGGEIIYDIEEKILRCKWHDWKFCSNSGKCLSYPIKGSLYPYEFQINPKKLLNYSSKIKGDQIYAIKK